MAKVKIDQVKRIVPSTGRFDIKFTVDGQTSRDQIKYSKIRGHLDAHGGRDDEYSKAAYALWLEIEKVFPKTGCDLATLQAFAKRAECAELLDGITGRDQAWEALFGETDAVQLPGRHETSQTIDVDDAADDDGDVLGTVKKQAEKSDGTKPKGGKSLND